MKKTYDPTMAGLMAFIAHGYGLVLGVAYYVTWTQSNHLGFTVLGIMHVAMTVYIYKGLEKEERGNR
jgi:hypothetical protein